MVVPLSTYALVSSFIKVVEFPAILVWLKVVKLLDLSSKASTASMIVIAEVFAHSPLISLKLVLGN